MGSRVSAFLAALRITPSITVAAKCAGIDRSAHYRRLERDEAYKAAFEAALKIGVDSLEAEAIRRAHYGVRKPVMYHGKPVRVPIDPAKPRGKKEILYEVEYSDTLLLALLKAKKPDEYRDRVSAELTGKGGGPIDTRLEIVFVDAPSDASRIPEDPPPAV